MTQKGWNKTNATNYEHYSIDYHRKNYDAISWHWTQIPETVLYESGFVHDFNNLRMKRKERFEEEGTYYNPVREYGLDGISKSIDNENNVSYNGIQSKLWERSLRAHDLGSFYQVIFARMRKHNNKSKGYLYHNGKLQVDVRDDILNLRGDILNIHLPYNENIQNNFLGNVTTTNTVEIMEEKDYILRDYQKEAIEKLNSEWDGTKLLHLPCGMGKTVIFNHHVKDKDYKNVFIISPLRIHTKQNLERIKAYLPEHKTLLLDSDNSGSTDFKDLEKIINDKSIVSTTFDSAQTLFAQLFEEDDENEQENEKDDENKEENEHEKEEEDEEDEENEEEENEDKELICKYDLSNSILIVDEAHNLMNKDELIKIVKAFPKVLLVTATPPSSIEEIIGCEVIYQYEFRKAIEEKHICDYQIYLPMIEKEGNIMIDIPEELLEMNNDNTKKSLFLLNGMLHTGSKKCIVYVSSKEECNDFMKNIIEVNNKYHYLPLGCNKIVSETNDKEREEIIKEFQKNENDKIKIICSIRILNEGVDIPKCDSIFITHVGDNSNDIVTVQRLCRANRLVKENPNKIANCFMWCDDLNKCVNTLSLLKENDIKFADKIKYLYSNYDNKYNKNSLELEVIENNNLQEFINIKCIKAEDIWEMKKNLLFEYVELNKKVPTQIQLYKEIKIGMWLQQQKKIINDKMHERYIKLSINLLIKNSLDTFLDSKNKNLKRVRYDFNKIVNYLFDFCNINKRIIKQKENNIGKWYSQKKRRIKSVNDELYKIFSQNKYIKEDLDIHLGIINKWNEHKNLLFEYVNIYNKIPTTKYKEFGISDWFQDQKKEIKSENDELYIILSKNEIIKKSIDKCLELRRLNEGINRLTWNEWKLLVFEYCDNYEKIPVNNQIYKKYNIGNWINTQKKYIKNISDDIYIQLSENKYIKESLDKYLTNKEKNKDKIKLTWEEWKDLLFEFCEINKRSPNIHEKYKEYNIANWLYITQKKKILSGDNELYIKLSENSYIKEYLDKIINKKI